MHVYLCWGKEYLRVKLCCSHFEGDLLSALVLVLGPYRGSHRSCLLCTLKLKAIIMECPTKELPGFMWIRRWRTMLLMMEQKIGDRKISSG